MNPVSLDTLDALHWRSKNITNVEGLQEDLRLVLSELERACKALEDEQAAHSDTMDQRDHAEMWADRLAWALGEIAGIDIGEHSSGNDPWRNAWEGEPCEPH